MATNEAQAAALGIASVHGRSMTAASGRRMSVLAVTWPVATLSGAMPLKRRPQIPAKA